MVACATRAKYSNRVFAAIFYGLRAPFGNWHYIQIEQTTAIALKWVPGIVWDIGNPTSRYQTNLFQQYDKSQYKTQFCRNAQGFWKEYFWCVVVSLIIPCASKAARWQKKRQTHEEHISYGRWLTLYRPLQVKLENYFLTDRNETQPPDTVSNIENHLYIFFFCGKQQIVACCKKCSKFIPGSIVRWLKKNDFLGR